MMLEVSERPISSFLRSLCGFKILSLAFILCLGWRNRKGISNLKMQLSDECELNRKHLLQQNEWGQTKNV